MRVDLTVDGFFRSGLVSPPKNVSYRDPTHSKGDAVKTTFLLSIRNSKFLILFLKGHPDISNGGAVPCDLHRPPK